MYIRNVRRTSEAGPLLAVIALLVFVWLAIGWVMNITDLVAQGADTALGLTILRVVGIFIPIIGAFTGWF